MKIRRAFPILVAFAFQLTLLPAPGGQFVLTTNNGAITIAGYLGYAGAVNIPSVTNGMPVVQIGASAFMPNNANLTSVAIPNSITNIGSQAFYQCTALTNVSVTNVSIPTIPVSCFNGCTHLSAFKVPSSVTNIENAAFFGCSRLKNITMPNGLITIADNAFEDCVSLGTIMIPNTVTSVGQQSFESCNGATNIIIADGVTNIGSQAFCGCISLKSIIIPASVITIGSGAFQSCSTLTNVYFRGNPPEAQSTLFPLTPNPTVYYLPGKSGWGTTFGGRPTALWLPQITSLYANSSVPESSLQFSVNWASGMTIVVESCTNVANPVWTQMITNTLTSDSFHFSDSSWNDYPSRFYRARWQ